MYFEFFEGFFLKKNLKILLVNSPKIIANKKNPKIGKMNFSLTKSMLSEIIILQITPTIKIIKTLLKFIDLISSPNNFM